VPQQPAPEADTVARAKESDEPAGDRPDDDTDDLAEIQAGRLSKRVRDSAAVVARHLEGRRGQATVQTMLVGKVCTWLAPWPPCPVLTRCASTQSCAGAAMFFYDLLVLKTGGFVQVQQPAPFAAIAVSATVRSPSLGMAARPAVGRGSRGPLPRRRTCCPRRWLRREGGGKERGCTTNKTQRECACAPCFAAHVSHVSHNQARFLDAAAV
jgi:hypothetical protein